MSAFQSIGIKVNVCWTILTNFDSILVLLKHIVPRVFGWWCVGIIVISIVTNLDWGIQPRIFLVHPCVAKFAFLLDFSNRYAMNRLWSNSSNVMAPDALRRYCSMQQSARIKVWCLLEKQIESQTAKQDRPLTCGIKSYCFSRRSLASSAVSTCHHSPSIQSRDKPLELRLTVCGPKIVVMISESRR